MKQLFTRLPLMLLIFAAMATNTRAQDSRVMIQGFNWESSKVTGSWYDIVQSKATDLSNSQIDMIWMPPPSEAASLEGYLPRRLYVLDSEYGSEAQLKNCINTLHANGIEVVADIVINHRVGVLGWADFQQPAWGCWAVTANDEWGQNGGNPCGNWDTGGNYHAARDIDHTNPTVQSDLIAWMNWLKTDIGFDGWRYDYVRGFNGYYNGLYNDATSPSFSVGELWDNLDINNADAHRQQLVDWIDDAQGKSTAFDFTTKGILQQAVNGELWRLSNNGQAPGLIGWWPEKAVTFVDNHDTGSTQAYWPFPGDKVMQGYAYILTHPGIPTIFWDHFYDWGLHDEIKALVQVRKDNGLNSNSQLDIQVAEWNRYAAVIDGKVAMKIGSGDWSPTGSDWTLTASGNDYAVWTKGGNTTPPPASGSLTVHFKKPSDWNNATVYFWQENNGNPTSSTTWPGEGMTDQGNGWYSYTINDGECSSLIFSDNGASQTDDLYRCGDGWYDSGAWSDTAPGNPIGSNDLTVYFKPNGYSNPTVYFWQVDNGETTTWPGEAMANEGNGWYSYTFANANCANVIFSNSGASQTADLSRCGTGWYNGSWHDSNPDLARTASNANQVEETLAKNKAEIEESRVGNHPNPFSEKTEITFHVAEKSNVSLTIYNILGEEVSKLLDSEEMQAGRQSVSFEAGSLKAGVYIYRLRINGKAIAKRMTLK